MIGLSKTHLVALCVAGIVSGSARAGEKIYWTTDVGNRIQRANPDGTNVETVVFGIANPLGLALDTEEGTMYWTQRSSGEIWRANLDGDDAAPIILFASGTELRGIALDRTNRRLYWVNETTQTIQRMSLGGGDMEDVIRFGPQGRVIGVTLDVEHNKMYWGDYAQWRIMQADLDGNDVTPLIQLAIDRPYYLEPDTENRQLYWVDYLGQRIRRVSLDGGEAETLVQTVAAPIGIALDIPHGKVYWTLTTGVVQRANLDGTGVEDVVIDLDDVWAIELATAGVGVPAYSTLGLAIATASIALLAGALLRRRALHAGASHPVGR